MARKYYCEMCGSDNILVHTLINPNTNERVYSSTCQCLHCGRETGYYDSSVRKEGISKGLEALVHRRFNIDTLNKAVSKILGEEVKLELGRLDTDEPDWCYQWNSEKEDAAGFYDIYVLMQRNTDCCDNNLYVTEVGYEFDF